MKSFLLIVLVSVSVIIIILIASASARSVLSRQSSSRINKRIDCYPEAESQFSGYSKQSCLARNCLFDDGAGPDVTQCYLSPSYGYILQGSPEQTPNGLRLKLHRNSAVASMFQQPIENALLDVQYYTDDIIRFKLYDADNERYEVRKKVIDDTDTSVQRISFLIFHVATSNKEREREGELLMHTILCSFNVHVPI